MTVAALHVAPDRSIRYCNPLMKKIFGYYPEEIMGKKTDLLYGDRRMNPTRKGEIYEALEQYGFHVGRAEGTAKDSKKKDLILYTFLVKPNEGAVILIKEAGKGEDFISFDKGLFLHSLLDNIPDMIYFKDLSNRFIMVNKAHADAAGKKPEEIIGKTDMDLFPDPIGKRYFDDDSRVVKTGKAIIGKIEKARRPDGGMTYVSTTKIPHYDDEGNIVGTIGITRNITEKMIAEEELHNYKNHLEDIIRKRTKALQESNERLLRMYNIKSDFTSMVSHELRTPLATIMENVSIVADGLLGSLKEKQKKHLDIAMANLERFSRLINEILDFSKLENKKIEFRIVEGNLNEVMNQVLRSYETIIKKKGLKLHTHMEPSLPLARFDSDRINQVISNIVDNAIKYTTKGFIKIETKAKGREVMVTVEDSGCGIKKQDMPRIFERFEQIISEETGRMRGTGLGLAISKQIIEQLGGSIFVKSEYKRGSKFSFTLPITRKE